MLKIQLMRGRKKIATTKITVSQLLRNLSQNNDIGFGKSKNILHGSISFEVQDEQGKEPLPAEDPSSAEGLPSDDCVSSASHDESLCEEDLSDFQVPKPAETPKASLVSEPLTCSSRRTREVVLENLVLEAFWGTQLPTELTISC